MKNDSIILYIKHYNHFQLLIIKKKFSTFGMIKQFITVAMICIQHDILSILHINYNFTI
jgi:hypothetical protein